MRVLRGMIPALHNRFSGRCNGFGLILRNGQPGSFDFGRRFIDYFLQAGNLPARAGLFVELFLQRFDQAWQRGRYWAGCFIHAVYRSRTWADLQAIPKGCYPVADHVPHDLVCSLGHTVAGQALPHPMPQLAWALPLTPHAGAAPPVTPRPGHALDPRIMARPKMDYPSDYGT